jgi:hypothetical protein
MGATIEKFTIISTHVKLKSGSTDMLTEDEINALSKVYDQALTKHADITNAIIAGDMNADCTYVKCQSCGFFSCFNFFCLFLIT